jgi:hypothetical protein
VLLLLLLGTALVLGGLFIAGSLFLQPTLYNEPTQGIVWRGAAAGGAVTVVLALWCFLALKAPDGRYATLLQFNPKDSTTFDEIWVPGPDGKKTLYKRVPGKNGLEAFQRDGRSLRSRPMVIFVKDKETGQEAEFKPDLDAKGNFKPDEYQVLWYRDKRGRTMDENSPGSLNTFLWGVLFLNLFINLAFFLALFASLWLLLEFHFWHAFGLAVALWIVLILFAIPPLIGYAESLGRG